MKTTLNIFVTFLFFSACSYNEKASLTDSLETKNNHLVISSGKKGLNKPAPEVSLSSDWNYHDYNDEMTGKKIYTAELEAKYRVRAQFTYGQNAQLRPSLVIRKTGNVNDVELMVPKGVFAQTTGGSVNVKFDNNPPTKFVTDGTADYSPGAVFIDRADNFISKVKTAKKVLIEAQFYRSGSNIIEFNVSGLKWNN